MATACGDDGGAADGSTSSATVSASSTGTGEPTTDDSPSTSTSGSTSGSTGSSSTPSGTGTTSTTAASTSADESGTTTGAGSTLILQNDGWEDGDQVAYQEGFVQGECWASVYVPPANLGPFTLDGISMLVGGDDMGEAEFSVGLWEVDDQNQPTTELDVGTTLLSGMDMGFDGTTVDALMLDAPVFEDQNFAIVVCLLAHDGFPAIGRDADGTIAEDLNWIRLENGTWTPATDLGLTGDWIMRATVRLQ